jgi:putative SOS response-associated peptidase YedK
MYGRYSLFEDIEELAERFAFQGNDLLRQARFNIAPGQGVLTITNAGSRNRARSMKWGLIPFWAKNPSIRNRMINTKVEPIETKPMVRQTF